ncbi:MAG: YicC family protein [Alphaproteobacteria bacterium]|nr:YicC family protein [Alphaproteobacteria bacterium]
MPISSMTGFARQEGRSGAFDWAWEMRSVNGRGLDIRLRLPNGLEELEGHIRAAAPQHFNRGNIQVSLQFDQRAQQELRVNQDVLAQVLRELAALRGTPGTADATLDGVLALRGVLELQEQEIPESDIEARDIALRSTFDEALGALDAARRDEGARIDATLRGHLDLISQLVAKAEAIAAARPGSVRDRLRLQIDELLADRPGLPEECLAQELALLMVKSDVSEEIQRLRAHVESANDSLNSGEAVGRRLDFLCQEFNREANTLCSKASDVSLTAVGLDLKVEVDRLREQVQNVE